MHAHPNPQERHLVKRPHPHAVNTTLPLTTLRRNLHRCTLRSLLALYPRSLTFSRVRSTLRLLGLLCALRGSLLLFAGYDSGFASCLAGFRALGAAFFDYIEGGADDSALVLDCAAGALLGYFLFEGKLLVLWPWENGTGEKYL